MKYAETRQEGTYQGLLRTLGAHLDRAFPSRVTLIERPQGFQIQLFQYPDAASTSQELTLTREAIAQQMRVKAARQQTTGAQPPDKIQLSATRQNAYRALGFELDTLDASNIALDELDDGVFLTYFVRDPKTGVRREEVSLLGVADIARITERAVSRRQK
jgi:hypothetical protein